MDASLVLDKELCKVVLDFAADEAGFRDAYAAALGKALALGVEGRRR